MNEKTVYKKALSVDITNIANGEALILGDYLVTREGDLLRIYQAKETVKTK